MRYVAKTCTRLREWRTSMVEGERWPEIMQKHGITTGFMSASSPEKMAIGLCATRARASESNTGADEHERRAAGASGI